MRLVAGNILYTPTTAMLGRTRYFYTITDARGGTRTGDVNVTVREPETTSMNVVSITSTAEGFLLRFAGIPGASYLIQFRDALSDPWQTLEPPGTLIAGPNGLFEFEDKPNPRPVSRFYRAAGAP